MLIINQNYCFLSDLKGSIFSFQCHLHISRSEANIYTVIISNLGIKIGQLNHDIIKNLFNQIAHDFYLDPAQSIFIRLA